jgi:shikimate dehydrogenase
VLLLGHPVAHSLSPSIQNAAFAALGRPDSYEAVDVPPDRLRDYLEMLRGGPYLGANITVPYKLEAAAAMDEADHDATLLGAVNTVVVRDGRLSGHNTDVHGAWEGLLGPVHDQLPASQVLILGAGGGARAVMLSLSVSPTSRPALVVVAVRRPEAGYEMTALADRVGLRARAVPWSEREAELAVAGVVVNTTPLGLAGDEDPLEGMSLSGKVVLDLAYRPGGTPLFRRAWREGAIALQGDEMLLHQGAAAFKLWTGADAPLLAMRKALKEAIGA